MIDEYDPPLSTAFNTSNEYLGQLTNFLRNLFSVALKGNPYWVLSGDDRLLKKFLINANEDT